MEIPTSNQAQCYQHTLGLMMTYFMKYCREEALGVDAAMQGIVEDGPGENELALLDESVDLLMKAFRHKKEPLEPIYDPNWQPLNTEDDHPNLGDCQSPRADSEEWEMI